MNSYFETLNVTPTLNVKQCYINIPAKNAKELSKLHIFQKSHSYGK